jgi:DNA (cytosine-5)-methyltransferase 1
MTIPFVDLFAGPGGLNEGFSSLSSTSGEPLFSALASFEMDASACETLVVRGAYRRVFNDPKGKESYLKLLRGETSLLHLQNDLRFGKAIRQSRDEVHRLELGPESRRISDRIIKEAFIKKGLNLDDLWVLVGGPPCQAYSLAGRSRRRNDETFEDDHKHFLYREYLNILSKFRPPIFVMENVKGLLSSKHEGAPMFERIIFDLSSPSRTVKYRIYSFTVAGHGRELRPDDFVIRSEEYGVPQRRHRIILLGIREDLHPPEMPVLQRASPVSVFDAIGDLPALRSGLSRVDDTLEKWLELRERAGMEFPAATHARQRTRLNRGAPWQKFQPRKRASELSGWLESGSVVGLAQHETRSHMQEDLLRYWFAANYAVRNGSSPTLKDFPLTLMPNHANAQSPNRPFNDRFRVQVWDRPSTTVVSHIAKDGHYYIHPDPDQMRSLTLREAARLQTFPDDYLFLGNKTNQFVQVGNAVPPLLAKKIAAIVATIAGSV